MEEAMDTGIGAASTAKEQPLRLPPISMPADRLRQTVPWMLRDYRYKRDALNAELQKLYAQDDFDPAEIDALEEANEARFSQNWLYEALTDDQVAMIAKAFNFAESDGWRLSKRLAHALNPDVEPVTVDVPRDRASNGATLGLDQTDFICIRVPDTEQ